MPQALYLQGADVASYGASSATAAQIQQASGMVDAYLKRPEGLLWLPDAAGQPCYMTNFGAQRTYVSAGAVAPGTNVVVTVAGLNLPQDTVGTVLVFDRATSGATEACVISAAAPGTMTLASVAFAHASGTSLEAGLVITEERQLAERRSVSRVSSQPLVRLIAGQGRYAYGRRSQQILGFEQEFNLLADLGTLGGPPVWLAFDVTQAGMSSNGDIWIPAGIYLAEYTEVRLHYVAGWNYAALPPTIKQATASLANALANQTSSPLAKAYTVGPLKTERFTASNLDDDTKRALVPFMARAFF